MRIAIVGCGFVADYYLSTLPVHPDLELAGVADRDPARAERFARFYAVHRYACYEDVLGDPQVDLVVNLTNPRSHYTVSRAALEAGKHVYSEKPLAMDFAQAKELVALAETKGRAITGAPCSILGETAQTIWKALRANVVGPVRLVYAEMDDGMVHRMPYKGWISASGTPWPYKDEFEVGCTLEHAGYYLPWLAAFFGPARSVTAFASVQIPDKGTEAPLDQVAPDVSVACIQFESGVVARLSCTIVAEHDHRLRIFGDAGILSTRDCWHYKSPVRVGRMIRIRRRTMKNPFSKRIPLVKSPYGRYKLQGAQQMDFMRGVAELASALREGRRSPMPADFYLHVNEMALAIHHAAGGSQVTPMTTTFAPLDPMPWAL
jgi:predicted dehydrogenase